MASRTMHTVIPGSIILPGLFSTSFPSTRSLRCIEKGVCEMEEVGFEDPLHEGQFCKSSLCTQL